jgi:hypothetical protein
MMKLRFPWIGERARRFARVFAYFSFVTLILGTIAARRTYGSMARGALEIGGGLAQLGEVVGPSYRVMLNGEAMNVSSTMTDLSVDQVLDRFDTECREHSGGLEEELGALPSTVRADVPPSAKGPAGVGVMTTREKDRGMVACIARDADVGYEGTAKAFGAFVHSGDLADLGRLMYVRADRMPSGRTHVVAAWTDGPFRIGHLFPAAGDCPGSDLPDTFRPEGSRRLLTASVEGAPFGVRIYDTSGTPDDALAAYEREMPAHGWTGVRTVDQHMDGAHAFMKGAVDLFVTAQPSRDGKSTVLSVISMPPR